MSDTIRVLRLVEYEGERALVEHQIERSIHGTRFFGAYNAPQIRITAVTLGIYPEVIEDARKVHDPREDDELFRQNALLLAELADAKTVIREMKEEIELLEETEGAE